MLGWELGLDRRHAEWQNEAQARAKGKAQAKAKSKGAGVTRHEAEEAGEEDGG